LGCSCFLDTSSFFIMPRRCAHPGCTKRPVHGLELGEATHCKSHASEGMTDVAHKRCTHPGCTKRPAHGLELGKATHCKSHASEGMTDVVSKRCAHPGCTKRPAHGLELGEATHCKSHASEGMTDVAHKRCARPGCQTLSGTRYDGFCLRCHVYMFPDKPVARAYKVKEQHVADFVAALQQSDPSLAGSSISFDRIVAGGCSRRRPDVLLDLGTHSVIVEVDEGGHATDAYCSCEDKRVMELFQDLGNRPLVVIRFNPDAYVDSSGVRLGAEAGGASIEDRGGDGRT
jgi:EsV-1-7 cysteine-rich motif